MQRDISWTITTCTFLWGSLYSSNCSWIAFGNILKISSDWLLSFFVHALSWSTTSCANFSFSYTISCCTCGSQWTITQLHKIQWIRIVSRKPNLAISHPKLSISRPLLILPWFYFSIVLMNYRHVSEQLWIENTWKFRGSTMNTILWRKKNPFTYSMGDDEHVVSTIGIHLKKI